MTLTSSASTYTAAATSPSSYIHVEAIGKVDDLTKLVYINETKLINELSVRYKQKKIYVSYNLYLFLDDLI